MQRGRGSKGDLNKYWRCSTERSGLTEEKVPGDEGKGASEATHQRLCREDGATT